MDSFEKVYLPLKILNFATFLQYQRFVMPISFLFYIDNGLSFSEFILFQSIFNVTVLIVKIPMGIIGDFISKKNVLIISYFLFMLRVILWIFFKGFWIVLIGEILYGLFKAMYRGNVDSYIYEWIQKQNSEQVMVSRYGKLSFWTSLGSAISCIAGAFLYKYFGFKILLYIELFFQIIAVGLLFLLPNVVATKENKSNSIINKLKSQFDFKALLKSPTVPFVYYTAILTGLTAIYVWNFQPILKSCSAPIILFGFVSFTNQIFRGIGGLFANLFTKNISEGVLFKIEYLSMVVCFISIYSAHNSSNLMFAISNILLICVCICLFVIFNVYTISKIHENTANYNRATISSANTFLSDFSAFIMLLIFKHLYDIVGWNLSITAFFIICCILTFPGFKIFHKLS